ncbi:MAG: DPP IV N-terminal domain-containing protein, partial [Saprospiraceae bacterium]
MLNEINNYLMKMHWLISLFVTGFVIIPLSKPQAQTQITIDDIWTNGKFWPKGVPGFRFMNDGHHYTSLKDNTIVKYDLSTGKSVDTILNINSLKLPAGENEIDDYTFSDNESQLLLSTGKESIYRRSTKEWDYVYNFSLHKISRLSVVSKQMHATFSPDGTKVAYVMDNDLYVKNLNSGKTTRVTTDGKINAIINGSCDWVYEEEFSFSKALAWSPDSRHLAYYRFDERNVKEITMTNYTGEMYPEMETFKYPKVGMENSKVSIRLFDTKTKKKAIVNRTSDPDGYIPRIKWTTDPSKLCVFWMNRHQNHLELLLANATDGKTSPLLQEDNKYYVDIHDNLTFLADKTSFIWTSEKDGYNHIYLYGMDGKLKRQITSGAWEVTEFYGVDEKNKVLFFQADKKSPQERELYRIDLNGSQPKLIKGDAGTNSAQFSTTYDLFVWSHSGINIPSTYSINDRDGKLVRMLEDNATIRKLQEEYKVQPVEFFNFTTSDGVKLNGYQIKPYNFDPTRKYPVFMHL